MKDFKVKNRYQVNQQGFSLMEVLIAIAIFAIGMLALASFQGALTRSSAEAKVRTTAVNIAEQIIEGQKGFALLSGGAFSFAGIADVLIGSPIIFDSEMTRNPATPVGMIYTVTQDVTDYYYDLADDVDSTKDAFKECPTCTTTPDFKTVTVKVDWDDNRDFVIDENTQAGNLGGGSIQVTATISNVSVAAALKVTEETDDDIVAPDIVYSPGLRPDVVALTLAAGRFKESLQPEPDVIRADELVETRFDVITYSQSGSDAEFLRREEFSAVSCECTLRAASEAQLGRRPVVWAGDEYAGGQFVEKPYGESANNLQSSICDSCCRDHHDGGSSVEDNSGDEYYNVYGPFKTDGTAGTVDEYTGEARTTDHIHYQQDGETPAVFNDVYLEACRLVRVDGFFRVAQDFRREDQYVFPVDFLDSPTEITDYSTYVTDAVEAYHGDTGDGYPTRVPNVPCIGDPSCGTASPTMQSAGEPVSPGQLPSWTTLPFGPVDAPTQQLRSRGIYIDYISDDLRSVLTCLSGVEGSAETCTSGDVELDKTGSENILEILPFFDVQLTFLNRWNESPVPNTPVDTTNEALADNNSHSRGVASNDDDGDSMVEATSHRGNLGFTDTPAIDPTEVYNSYVTVAELEVFAGDGGPVLDPTGELISGSLTESLPGNPSITVTGADFALCGQTGANYACLVTESPATVTISGYGKNGFDRYACSTGPITFPTVGSPVTSGVGASTTFNLGGLTAGDTYDINLQGTPCT